MFLFGIILIIIGALALILGVLILSSLLTQVFIFLVAHSDLIGGSCVFFGAIAFIAGMLVVLSLNNNNARVVIKKLVSAKEFILIIVVAAVVYLFWAINQNYLSVDNIRAIFNSAFVMGIIAVGMSCLLISGQIDLSAGSTGMMGGVIIALLLKGGVPWVPALFITLVFGTVTGLINAAFVNGLNFMSFISTLAVSTAFGGLSLVLTNAQTITIRNKSFWALGSTNVLGIFPLPFFIAIVLMAVYGGILSSTRFGRRIYMAGGNPHAARLAGINPKKITTVLFVNNSVIACLAGSLVAARMQMGSTSSIVGSDLDAITAAVLGGISFMGGGGNMFGVFIGILLLTSFKNGLVVAGLGSYYQIIASGLLLIAALTLDFIRERARVKAVKAGIKDLKRRPSDQAQTGCVIE